VRGLFACFSEDEFAFFLRPSLTPSDLNIASRIALRAFKLPAGGARARESTRPPARIPSSIAKSLNVDSDNLLYPIHLSFYLS